MPLGSKAPLPTAILVRRHAEQHDRLDAEGGELGDLLAQALPACAARRPGATGSGTASSIPSRTNSGAIRSAVRTVVSATRSRNAGVERRRRRRDTGKLSHRRHRTASAPTTAATIASSSARRRRRRRRGRVAAATSAVRRPIVTTAPARRGPTPSGDVARRTATHASTAEPLASTTASARAEDVELPVVGWRRAGGVGLDGDDVVPGGAQPGRRAGRRRDPPEPAARRHGGAGKAASRPSLLASSGTRSTGRPVRASSAAAVAAPTAASRTWGAGSGVADGCRPVRRRDDEPVEAGEVAQRGTQCERHRHPVDRWRSAGRARPSPRRRCQAVGERPRRRAGEHDDRARRVATASIRRLRLRRRRGPGGPSPRRRRPLRRDRSGTSIVSRKITEPFPSRPRRRGSRAARRRRSRAPSGNVHPAPSSARKARSVDTANRVGPSSTPASRPPVRSSSARHSTATHPWPTAGTKTVGSSRSAMRSVKPSTSRAATAITIAPSWRALCSSRRAMLPRSSTNSRSGRTSASWARRRTEPVATTAPAASSPRVRPIRASAASRLAHRAASARRPVSRSGGPWRSAPRHRRGRRGPPAGPP